MTPYLLVDFGTTSTKSALVDLDTGAFAHPQRYPATPLDETLLGLRALALVAEGRAGTCLEAQAIFGRECQVTGD